MEDHVKLLMDVFNILPDAMIIVDERGVIRECNALVGKVFGYSADELKGKPIDLLIPDRFHKTHAGHVENYPHETQPRKMGKGLKLVAKRKDGIEIEVDIALSPLSGIRGKLILAVVRDISERLNLERKVTTLKRTKKELEKFALTVSHDLKSPLQRIRMLTHLIVSQLPAESENSDMKEMVAHLNTSVLAMDHLICNILENARAEVEEREIVDLDKLLNEVKANILIPGTFQIYLPKPLPKVTGNHTRLFQVFLNLITNAIKYNDKPEGRLQIEWLEKNGFYLFSLDDNGCVVPPEKRRQIFKLFVRGEDTADRDSHGVGLSIVKGIIEKAGGEILYRESELGGSGFDFSWPAG